MSLWTPPDLSGPLMMQGEGQLCATLATPCITMRAGKRGRWTCKYFVLKGSNLFWFRACASTGLPLPPVLPEGHVALDGARRVDSVSGLSELAAAEEEVAECGSPRLVASASDVSVADSALLATWGIVVEAPAMAEKVAGKKFNMPAAIFDGCFGRGMAVCSSLNRGSSTRLVVATGSLDLRVSIYFFIITTITRFFQNPFPNIEFFSQDMWHRAMMQATVSRPEIIWWVNNCLAELQMSTHPSTTASLDTECERSGAVTSDPISRRGQELQPASESAASRVREANAGGTLPNTGPLGLESCGFVGSSQEEGTGKASRKVTWMAGDVERSNHDRRVPSAGGTIGGWLLWRCFGGSARQSGKKAMAHPGNDGQAESPQNCNVFQPSSSGSPQQLASGSVFLSAGGSASPSQILGIFRNPLFVPESAEHEASSAIIAAKASSSPTESGLSLLLTSPSRCGLGPDRISATTWAGSAADQGAAAQGEGASDDMEDDSMFRRRSSAAACPLDLLPQPVRLAAEAALSAEVQELHAAVHAVQLQLAAMSARRQESLAVVEEAIAGLRRRRLFLGGELPST